MERYLNSQKYLGNWHLLQALDTQISLVSEINASLKFVDSNIDASFRSMWETITETDTLLCIVTRKQPLYREMKIHVPHRT